MLNAGWKMSRPEKLPGQLPEGDADLLYEAYRQVIPLKGHARVTHELGPVSLRPSQQILARRARAVAQPAPTDKLSDGDAHSIEDVLEHYQVAGVSGESLRRLKREADRIRECLDLHGLTRDQARAALGHFVRAASARGITRVRIIHGQGYGSHGGTSVLRYLARHWLSQMPEVLGFVTPPPAQGGKGAVIALLRATQVGQESLC